jgi:hypothetical protein
MQQIVAEASNSARPIGLRPAQAVRRITAPPHARGLKERPAMPRGKG